MKTAKKTVAIVTLYHPKPETAESLKALGEQVDRLILSDNTPGGGNRELLAGIPGAVYLANGENLGLAAGINRGLDTAEARESDYVFFFDQDSRIGEGHIAAMVRDWEALAAGHRIGLLGPRYYDEITGTYNADAILDGGVENSESAFVPIRQIITSSMMTTWEIMRDVGFWNEEFFLDYGDYDLCWRLGAAGYEIFITKNVLLRHRLGEGCVPVRNPRNGETIPLSYGAPVRKYYQTRDALRLLKKDYIPDDWRSFLKQNLTIRRWFDLKYLPEKRENTRYYHKGLADGFRNREGEIGRTREGGTARSGRLVREALYKNLGASVLTMAVAALNTTVDALLMGNLLGPKALSAINLSMPLSYMLVTVQCFLAFGASLRASRKLGERQHAEADRIFTVGLAGVFAAGLLLTLLAGRLAGPAVRILCEQPSLAAGCGEYFRMEIRCSVVTMLQIALSGFAQRAGNPKIVLAANVVSLAVNAVADVAFVRALNLGIGGAALATGVGAAASGLLLAAWMVKRRPFRLRNPGRETPGILLANIGSGTAAALQTAASGLLVFVLNHFIQETLGADGEFVLSVGMNFLTFTLFFAMGVQNTCFSMGSMMQGQGDATGLRMLFRSALRITFPVTLALDLVQLVFPRQLALLFGARTEAQLAIAVHGLPVVSLVSIPLALLLLLVSVYQVTGRFGLAAAVSVGLLGMLPLCLWLTQPVLKGEDIWYAVPLSEVLTILLTAAASEIFRRKKRNRLRFLTLLPAGEEGKRVLEGTIGLGKGGREALRRFMGRTVPYFESLEIGRKERFRIRLCVEEALDAVASRSRREKEAADVRIAAAGREVRVLIRDNLPRGDAPDGEEQQTNRRILRAFCPDAEYRNVFLQNEITMDWKYGDE